MQKCNGKGYQLKFKGTSGDATWERYTSDKPNQSVMLNNFWSTAGK